MARKESVKAEIRRMEGQRYLWWHDTQGKRQWACDKMVFSRDDWKIFKRRIMKVI
jgi:hypothetical protein